MDENRIEYFQEFQQNPVVFFLYSFITNTSPSIERRVLKFKTKLDRLFKKMNGNDKTRLRCYESRLRKITIVSVS